MGSVTSRKPERTGGRHLGQRGDGLCSTFLLGGPVGKVVVTSRVAASSTARMRAERQVSFTGGTIRHRDVGEAMRFIEELRQRIEWLLTEPADSGMNQSGGLR